MTHRPLHLRTVEIVLASALLLGCEGSDESVNATDEIRPGDGTATAPASQGSTVPASQGHGGSAPGVSGMGGELVDVATPVSEPDALGGGGSGGNTGVGGSPSVGGGASGVPGTSGGAGPAAIGGTGGGSSDEECAGGAPDGGAAEAAPPSKPPPLWNERSIRVNVDEEGYWGSTRVEQDRQWLTDEQVDLLAALDFEFVRVDPCAPPLADGDSITVTVTDDDGSMRSATSATNPEVDGWYVTSSIRRFLGTFECRGGIYYAAEPLDDPPETAPHVAPNDGCHHRFLGAGWFAAVVASSGSYRLQLSGACDEESLIRVHAAMTAPDAGATSGPLDAGPSIIAESNLDGGCPTLVLELPDPGTYPVYVVGGNDAYLRMTAE